MSSRFRNWRTGKISDAKNSEFRGFLNLFLQHLSRKGIEWHLKGSVSCYFPIIYWITRLFRSEKEAEEMQLRLYLRSKERRFKFIQFNSYNSSWKHQNSDKNRFLNSKVSMTWARLVRSWCSDQFIAANSSFSFV